MKLVLLIFFTLTFPLFLLLTSLQFGGLTRVEIKKSLADSPIYDETSSYIAKAFNSDSADLTEQQFGTIIKERFTPGYIQNKTETTLDQTGDWITGKSQSVPKISFKELKDDIVAQNPDLIPSLQQAAKQAEQTASEQNADQSQTQQLTNTVNMFNSMVNSDFTFDLQRYVQGLKIFYTVSRIWLVVVAVLLLASLFGVAKLASNSSARCMWIGTTMITSGIIGLLTVFLNSLILKVSTQAIVDSSNTYLNLIKPFILAVGSQVVHHYITLEQEISIGMISFALLLFVCARIVKPKINEIPSKKKKK